MGDPEQYALEVLCPDAGHDCIDARSWLRVISWRARNCSDDYALAVLLTERGFSSSGGGT